MEAGRQPFMLLLGGMMYTDYGNNAAYVSGTLALVKDLDGQA